MGCVGKAIPELRGVEGKGGLSGVKAIPDVRGVEGNG